MKTKISSILTSCLKINLSMLLYTLFKFLYFCISVVFAGVLKPQRTRDPHSNRLTYSTNSSAPSRNVSAKNELEIFCDPSLGTRLSKTSCQMAFQRIGSETKIYSFGQRHTGQFSIPLPFRFMSCRSSPCIEPFLVALDGPQLIFCFQRMGCVSLNRCWN